MDSPITRYARGDDVSVAYQVFGDGPRDLVVNHGWVSNVEAFWDSALFARGLRRLTALARVIHFDKRGVGLSDRVPVADLPTLEQRMDDLRAAMDAAGSEKAVLYGYSEGAEMCALFAATYPERTAALVMYGSKARRLSAPDYPWGSTAEQAAQGWEALQRNWGGPIGLTKLAPSMEHDQEFAEQWARYLRQSASPAAAIALARMNSEIDIRSVLPAIKVPTLVLHRTGDREARVEEGRYVASRIPGARYVELPGSDHVPWVGESADTIIDEIEEFLTGVRHAPEVDRVLTTVLFTDIVGSTERLSALGDRRWRDVLEEHYRLARRELSRFRGREIKTTGDGLLASFDGPARAVRCAVAIRDAIRPLGIEIRAGLHTGEVEVMTDDLGGIAVHVGARVMAEAGPGEVIASSTVKDLVAGSGLAFTEHGTHTLRGVQGDWRLFRIMS
jgi:pimeloyl-ACP methyl ester carboxylesterase